MGARQHLLQLQKKGLVENFQKAEKVGRPSQYWQLTELAQANFPDGHDELARNMLIHVKEVFGEEGLEQITHNRFIQQKSQYESVLKDKVTLEGKIDSLKNIRVAEGYMAMWEKSGEHYYFVENHCPISVVAADCLSFCKHELQLFQACLEQFAMVERTEHFLAGNRRCTYKITPYPELT